MARLMPNPSGRIVLITGGTGSFGRAFVRHLLSLDDPYSSPPKAIRILSRNEHRQAEMAAEWGRESEPGGRLRFLIGDVRDRERMKQAVQGCHVVVHAAALKRVEAAERDPAEAIKTNVTGTMNVVDAAIAEDVERVLILSSDKAASPVTTYGVSKLMAERYAIASNAYVGVGRTKVSCTRYGNVFGSQGSVIHLFRQQLLKDGHLTLTDPDATRFIMRMEEAIKLVEIALANMRGGEVFLPTGLKSASVAQLANAAAPTAERNVIGLRGFEKAHESLVSPDEVRYLAHFDKRVAVLDLLNRWQGRLDTDWGTDLGLTSDTADRLTEDELKELVEEVHSADS
ncbi:MAG: SDR family NAD(P)-dependent oxidoreductase [Dehalococcoidia bacterium]|nr:SDR family NAD(P)-dependent oxidoreductase [Dehalococcoidia bacterium]